MGESQSSGALCIEGKVGKSCNHQTSPLRGNSEGERQIPEQPWGVKFIASCSLISLLDV